MKKVLLMSLLCWVGTAHADKLPDWVQAAVDSSVNRPAPEGAAVWTLLDRTDISLRSNGKWSRKRQVVRRVLQQQGGDDAAYFLIDGEEGRTKIKKFKAWKQRHNGDIYTLDKDNMVSIGRSSLSNINREVSTLASFKNVNRGDLIAFQSDEIEENYFSISAATVLSDSPILLRIIHIDGLSNAGTPVLKAIGLEDWSLKVDSSADTLTFHDLPGLEDEFLTSNNPWVTPYVLAGFLIGADDPMSSWDALAKMYAGKFPATAGLNQTGRAAEELGFLQQTCKSITDRITYNQVYLSAERGWEPLPGKTVYQKAYGDCKDFVSCLAWKLEEGGVSLLPALTGPFISAESPTQVGFNHVIAAIPLSKSLGLASEVEAQGQRYLMVDPTSRETPLGLLPSGLEGESLMICRPEGAVWVKVSSAMVEPNALKFRLEGNLDQNYTFSGKLDIQAQGYAAGLRSFVRDGNHRKLEIAMRTYLDIPGSATVQVSDPKLTSDGQVALSIQLIWPGFLRRDAGGVCLPNGIVGREPLSLNRPGKKRQQAIWLDSLDSVRWQIAISTPKPLAPLKPEVVWDDTLSSLKWKVASGNTLTIDFERVRREAYYPIPKLEQGLADWETFRKQYSKFLIEATHFY